MFHIECKEPLRQFNEKLNNGVFNFEDNAVKVDVTRIICNSNNNILDSSHNSIFNIILKIPNYFLMGYDGMNYNSIIIKNKEKRSSGTIKKQDLLYLAKVSDDFKNRYFETLMFFNDTVEENSKESDNSNNNSSSSFIDDDDKDEFKKEMKLMKITGELEPEAQLAIICKCRMTSMEYKDFLMERIRERGQWICYHIMSFGPIRKEYSTLMTLTENPSFPICRIVTSGEIGKIDQYFNGNQNTGSEDITKYVIDEYHLNPSQADILKKIRNRKFSLVQGPPGTGKTTIIIAITVRAILESFYNNNSSFKVLVCAPSNYACDEIARRLERGNFLNIEDSITELRLLLIFIKKYY